MIEGLFLEEVIGPDGHLHLGYTDVYFLGFNFQEGYDNEAGDALRSNFKEIRELFSKDSRLNYYGALIWTTRDESAVIEYTLRYMT